MRKPTTVSLYSGAGGLDFGLEKAGFKPVALFESDEWCVKTLRENRDWPVFQKEISDSIDVRKFIDARSRYVDLLAGGPPCQPFSHAASWANGKPSGLDDVRANTVAYFMNIVEQILPKAVLVENVPGFARGEKSASDYVHRRFRKINKKFGTKYSVTIAIIDAADYGVPQHRRRLFLVAARDGTKFKFPSPTHGPKSPKKHRYVTAWDAIGKVQARHREGLNVKGRWGDLLASIPEGRNYLWHTKKGGGAPLFGWRTKYWSFLLKLAKNRPSWTLSASPSQNAGPFHWSNRQLSTDEMLRLQTFPKDVVILGDRPERQRQIGNAVPSLLGEILGREIRTQILGHKSRLRSKPKLRVRPTRNVPKKARTRPIPEKFRYLRGNHEDHPGAGKGPRARLRGESPSLS
jgi:DNA (cytosine-5)-methyltransferase 1